jgi:hypothetical protein
VLAQNMDSLLGVAGGLALSALVFLSMRRHTPDADNTVPVILVLSVASLAVNALFLRDRILTNGMLAGWTLIATAAIVLPVVLNLGLASLVVVRERASNAHFHTWLSEHKVCMGACIVLASARIENIGLAYSGILDKALFCAPVQLRTRALVQAFGVWKWMGDLVLLGAQLYAVARLGRDKRDVVACLALWLTALQLLHGVAVYALAWVGHWRRPRRTSIAPTASKRDSSTLFASQPHVAMYDWSSSIRGAVDTPPSN